MIDDELENVSQWNWDRRLMGTDTANMMEGKIGLSGLE
jgi:hypothetical protein